MARSTLLRSHTVRGNGCVHVNLDKVKQKRGRRLFSPPPHDSKGSILARGDPGIGPYNTPTPPTTHARMYTPACRTARAIATHDRTFDEYHTSLRVFSEIQQIVNDGQATVLHSLSSHPRLPDGLSSLQVDPPSRAHPPRRQNGVTADLTGGVE